MLLPVLAVLFATGFGLTAVLGGLSTVPDPPPEQLGPGDTLDQGRFSTRFVEAVYTLVRPPEEWEEERRYLDLVFEVTNKGNETTDVGSPPEPGKPPSPAGTLFASSILRTDPVIETRQGGFGSVRTRDGTQSTQLHPGVTSTVVVRYPLTATARVPDKITIDMGAFEYYSETFFFSDNQWWLATTTVDGKDVPATVARVTLPVRQEAA
ncbi:hypothetical protein SAMN04489764_2194 [Thermostaphylospora chromogena]|uniref:Uncharacterized protein n=1 Tax=Thermostaphylospora chromogena TaxID=35622 RepID=A0A1H1DXM2_9ACTN|nr:hypothetical protein SAMN04489764_2194 [Thermostaphylospora chromogena]